MQLTRKPKSEKKRGLFSRHQQAAAEDTFVTSQGEVTAEEERVTTTAEEVMSGAEDTVVTAPSDSDEAQGDLLAEQAPTAEEESGDLFDEQAPATNEGDSDGPEMVDHSSTENQPWVEVTPAMPDEVEEDEDAALDDMSLLTVPSSSEEGEGGGEDTGVEIPATQEDDCIGEESDDLDSVGVCETGEDFSPCDTPTDGDDSFTKESPNGGLQSEDSHEEYPSVEDFAEAGTEKEVDGFTSDVDGGVPKMPAFTIEQRPEEASDIVYSPNLVNPAEEILDTDGVMDELDATEKSRLLDSILSASRYRPVRIVGAVEGLCPACGRTHKLYDVTCEIETNKGGRGLIYPASYSYCDEIGSLFTTREHGQKNYRALSDEFRARIGLLTSKDIQTILSYYDVDADDLDTILSWEVGTTREYLAGETQRTEHNDTLNLIYNAPVWFLSLVVEARSRLPEDVYNRILSRTTAIAMDKASSALQEYYRESGITGPGLSDAASDDETLTDPEWEQDDPDAASEEYTPSEECTGEEVPPSEEPDGSESPSEEDTSDGEFDDDTQPRPEEKSASVSETPPKKPKKERRPFFSFLRKKRKDAEPDPFTEDESSIAKSGLPDIDLGDPAEAAGALDEYDENGVKSRKPAAPPEEYVPPKAEEEDDAPPPTPLEDEDTGDETLPDEVDSEDLGEEEDAEEEESRPLFGRKRESRRARKRREREEALLAEESEDEDYDEEDEGVEDYDEEEYEYEAPKDTPKDIFFFIIEISISAAVTALIGYQVGSVFLQNLVSTYLGG